MNTKEAGSNCRGCCRIRRNTGCSCSPFNVEMNDRDKEPAENESP